MDKSLYRPEIDGLRAVAVAAVVLFHVGAVLPGGYIGVDVFFVISGFLITGIIHRGIERSTFSLAEFWERRVRRILPALFVMILGTLGLGYFLLLPHELEALGRSSIAQALLLANVYFWRSTGYFTGSAELQPLLHTWSLAVEEQFYLLFPLFLVFFRTRSRKWLFTVFASVSVISLGGSIYGTIAHPTAAFFSLPTRGWELLVGSMLAVLPWDVNSRPRRDGVLAFTGLLAIVLPVFLYDSQTPFPGLAAMPPVIGTAVVIFATTATRATLVGWVLSLRPVVFVGLISYSLYLWHWPVIVFVRHYCLVNVSEEHLGWKPLSFALVCMLTLSILSWKFVETPCRQFMFQQQRRRLFGAALFMSGATIAVSMLFVGMKGLPTRFPNYSRMLLEDITWGGEEFQVTPAKNFDFDTLPLLGLKVNTGDIENRLDFLLWGDSHGMMLCPVMSDVAAEFGLSGKAILLPGHLPLPGACTGSSQTDAQADVLFRKELVEFIRVRRPRNLILVSRWRQQMDGCSETELVEGLEQLVALCEESCVELWVVKQVPEVGGISPAKDVFLWSVGRQDKLPDYRTSLDQHLAQQATPERVFGSISADRLRVLDPAPYLFGKDGMTIIVQDGRSFYKDDDHLTRHGAEWLRVLIKGMMQEIKEDRPAAKQAQLK